MQRDGNSTSPRITRNRVCCVPILSRIRLMVLIGIFFHRPLGKQILDALRDNGATLYGGPKSQKVFGLDASPHVGRIYFLVTLLSHECLVFCYSGND